ncbi:unnamed protein product, partial [marine sediment metagenome]
DEATGKKLVVDTASVDGKTVSRVVTTYYVTIDKDGTYTVKATKAGYERLEESFTEDCPHLLTFYMKEKVVTCSQVFYIKDEATGKKLVVDTASVDGKTVSRVVTTYYVTIDKDGTYTVKATKAGYERLEESFTED